MTKDAKRELALVRMRELRADGKNFGQIAKALNEEKVPTLGKANEWRQAWVRELVLRDEVNWTPPPSRSKAKETAETPTEPEAEVAETSSPIPGAVVVRRAKPDPKSRKVGGVRRRAKVLG